MLTLLAAAAAWATVPDTMGLGTRWMARGGGSVALVDDGTAAFVNPAGLAGPDSSRFGLGVLGGRLDMAPVPDLWWDTNRDGSVDADDPPLAFDATPDPVFGLDLHWVKPLGRRVGFGLTAWLPTRNLIRFSTFEPSLPYYLRWGNRLQRANLSGGLGFEPVDGVRVGLAVDLLARTRANVHLTLRASAGGGTGTEVLGSEVVFDVHRIDISVVPALAPVAGLQVDVGRFVPGLDGLTFGARYHGAVGLPLDVHLDAQADLSLADAGEVPYTTALYTVADFALFDHDVPQRVDLGLGYASELPVAAHVDARWTDWRGLTPNVARVTDAELVAPLVDLDGAVVDGNPLAYEVRATWGVRGGVEVRLPSLGPDRGLGPLQPALRAGAAFDPTPLVAQGDSALLDADHRMLGGGLGLQTGRPGLDGGAMGLDLMLQHHALAQGVLPRAATEPTAGYPVAAPGIPFGGRWFVLSAQWTWWEA